MVRAKRAQRAPAGRSRNPRSHKRAEFPEEKKPWTTSFRILRENDEAVGIWAHRYHSNIRERAINDMIAETAARHGLKHAFWPTEPATIADAGDASEEPAA